MEIGVIIGLAIAAVLSLGGAIGTTAALTGNTKTLCEKGLQGTYTPGPQGTDVCPDGDWRHLVGLIKDKRPTPQPLPEKK